MIATARKLEPNTLRAAWWALRASQRARRSLRSEPLEAALTSLPSVPPLPSTAERGVDAVLHRRSDTCLVRAMVRQAWNAAHGQPRDLVIGVAPRSGGELRAHAWLEGDPPCHLEAFRELLRRPAP